MTVFFFNVGKNCKNIGFSFARLKKIFSCFCSMFSFFSRNDLSVASFRKREFRETALNQTPTDRSAKCFGECCQLGQLSIDQKDSEKIAIGT